MSASLSPRAALHDTGLVLPVLPPCVHYAGSERFVSKALELQREQGPVFDIAADCEDGAPVGGEREHAKLLARLIAGERNMHGRVGARTHGVRHPAWRDELDILVGEAGDRLAFLTVPKSECAADVETYLDAVLLVVAKRGLGREIPVSVLIETPGAVHDAWSIAALPGLVSLDFGTLDFVSAHHGAIPLSAMQSPGQFDHALMRRAKAETAAAALAHGLVPTHGICQNIQDEDEIYGDARRARDEFGFLRMWSIHPNQIQSIVFAMRPDHDVIIEATAVLQAAQAADWAPISRMGKMHDRASYRYFWTVLERARASGAVLPDATQALFATELA